MAPDVEIAFRVELEEGEPDVIAEELRGLGAQADIEVPKGIVPLAVALVVVIPPGVALLGSVFNRILERWRRNGVMIDAREDGPPEVRPLPGTPFGTVLILSRDGDRSERSDLPEDNLSDYIAKAVGALTGGASASEADGKAN
jgi:hypothetical protein